MERVVEARALMLKLKYRRGRVARAMLSARELRVEDGSGNGLAGLSAAAIIVERHEQDGGGETPPGPAFDLTVEAEDITLSLEPVPGLGRKTGHLGIRSTVTGEAPGVLGDRASRMEAMARWRDSGGTLDVKSLDIRHGPLTVSGDGTLALDGTMQPIGSFTLRIRGFNEALDRLRAAGLIEPRPAALAKAVLGVLARKPGTGGDAEIKVPLSIQERQVFVGSVTLAKLPVFGWP